MIIPAQIKHGRWVVLNTGEKKYIDDVDYDGTISPVGHFSIHIVDQPGAGGGEWIGCERVQSVKGANPDPDKQPKTVDLGVASWSSTTKQMNEENNSCPRCSGTLKYDKDSKAYYCKKCKKWFDLVDGKWYWETKLDEQSMKDYLHQNSPLHWKYSKIFKHKDSGEEKTLQQLFRLIPKPSTDPRAEEWVLLGDDKRIEETLQCANCGEMRGVKGSGYDKRVRPVSLCMRCDNRNVRLRLGIS